jgi:hypothetical protein
VNKKQALALLQLMADCYTVINAPEPVQVPEAHTHQAAPTNGKGRARETQPVASAE